MFYVKWILITLVLLLMLIKVYALLGSMRMILCFFMVKFHDFRELRWKTIVCISICCMLISFVPRNLVCSKILDVRFYLLPSCLSYG